MAAPSPPWSVARDDGEPRARRARAAGEHLPGQSMAGFTEHSQHPPLPQVVAHRLSGRVEVAERH
eukprot:7994735-Pyramimonas_sp.AAC.1